ncbi:hypothetical protein [Proteiniphilum acetatigenes]|uniref:hypothetical protein n=1 Tax=Proteiniphilum acetatigenes TaxID=294710 RepID=UPI0003AA9296|nr:hypothetical protein [Proteiniphilum acetatigenes]SFK48715.1 hypothetical protein SAMN05216357_102356 [Porphyromonadaceae bacterium KH3CP3RA]
MKEIKLTIDITSPEGRQIVEKLKQFPDIVTFENDLPAVEEPVKTYKRDEPLDKDIGGEYIKSELFWELVERKRKKFCTDNGIV